MAGSIDESLPAVAVQGHRWLAAQQDPRTGLVRSFDMPGDRAAWSYDQALAILAFSCVGDARAASRCGDAMLGLRDGELGVWADGYNVETGKVTAAPLAAGSNAWMGLAMLALHGKTMDTRYLHAAVAVGEFLLSLQEGSGQAEGVIIGGLDQARRPFRWASTEHNADAIGFLSALADVTGEAKYRRAAVSAARWLDREMWDQAEQCYLPGYEDVPSGKKSRFPERLDSQTWTVLAHHAARCSPNWPADVPGARDGLSWIAAHECTLVDGGRTLSGFGKLTFGKWATPSVWTEGTAGYILARRAAATLGLPAYDSTHLDAMLSSLLALQRPDGSVPYSVGESFADVARQFRANDVVIAHFEGHPNALFGDVSVHGDAEPDWEVIEKAGRAEPFSWYYDATAPGCDKSNVNSGRQSFRLVNAGRMCKSRDRKWASLALDLCPVLDGKATDPLDVSDCSALAFWAKAAGRNDLAIEVHLRDTDPGTGALRPPRPIATVLIGEAWKKYTIDLAAAQGKVALNRLGQVTLEFGWGTGNPDGAVMYVDDVCFAASTPVEGPGLKPAVYPQHWPYGSVAGTVWVILTILHSTPFARPR